MRVRQIADGLSEIGELKIVVAGSAVDFPAKGDDGVERFLPLRDLPRGSRFVRYRRAFDLYANPFGRQVDANDRAWLEAHMEGFDLIWIHHLRTAHAFNRWKWPRSVMDIDDVSSTHCRSVAKNSEQMRERLKSGLQVHLIRRRERLLSERFTVVSVCSEADRDYLRLPGPVHVIPNGFEVPAEEPVRNPSTPPRIGFIGTFNYQPNVDSVYWFIRKCWPQIKREIPGVWLRLAGSNSYDTLKTNDPDIQVLGYVASPAAEIATWSLMIVPTRKGAGTRVKIADGFSKKVPMVTTSLGVCGYDVKSGVELYVADEHDDFARACVRAIKDPEASRRLAEAGWRRFVTEWSWEAIRPRIWAAAEDCLRRSHQSRTGSELVSES